MDGVGDRKMWMVQQKREEILNFIKVDPTTNLVTASFSKAYSNKLLILISNMSVHNLSFFFKTYSEFSLYIW